MPSADRGASSGALSRGMKRQAPARALVTQDHTVPAYACKDCGTPAPDKYGCPRHRRTPSAAGHRSPARDRSTQRAFRRGLIARDGERCAECGATEDLRACHILPLHLGGTSALDNGVMRCGRCDRLSDPHAR